MKLALWNKKSWTITVQLFLLTGTKKTPQEETFF